MAGQLRVDEITDEAGTGSPSFPVGNVGIGTSSPGAKLDVVTTTQALKLTTAANQTHIEFRDVTNSKSGFLNYNNDNLIYFSNGPTERMRIDSAGNVRVGVTSTSWAGHYIRKTGAELQQVLAVDNGGGGTAFFGANGGGRNTAGTAIGVDRNSTNNRSINAAGTINASGADYAEYMTKSGNFEVAKGDVVGINAKGKLTKVFADAISFCVKSTDPSYVGNDKWGCDFEQDQEGLEAARQCVDRIAFAGQVPVNVLGATPGQFIMPVNDNGVIAGQAVSNPTFEQYQIAVGKVIAIEDDGRARIIVKVA